MHTCGKPPIAITTLHMQAAAVFARMHCSLLQNSAKPTMQMDSKLPTSGLRPPACVRRGPQGGWSSPTRCRTYKRKDVRDEMSAHLPTCHPPGLVAQPRARAFLPVYIPTYTHLWASLTLPVRILTSLPPTPSR